MIKKNVLLFSSLGGFSDFFRSGYVREYKPVAIVTDHPKMISLTFADNAPKIDVLSPDDVPNFVYNMIDGIVLTDEAHRQENINYLLQRGVEARKIIPWDELGTVKPLTGKQINGVAVAMIEGLEFHLRDDNDRTFFNQIRTLLQNQKRFFAFDPQGYPGLLTRHHNAAMNHPLQWNNLQTWTEKMQWLKLFDATPLKSRLTDKYLVRYYVADRIGDEYLTPLLGVWDKFDDIDFDFMPDKFVLKCNHAPNFSIVVDKNSLDIRNLREKFTAMMQVDYGAQFTFELHYSAIKRRIIAEKFIAGDSTEYKFLCFNGKPIYCRHDDIYYDMNWDTADFETPTHTRKPKNFKLMKKLTEKLCGDFAFVRVDFREIDGDIYFDALEFTPSAGMIKFKSDAVDKTFGELLSLPNTPARLPKYNPDDFTLLSKKYSANIKFAHKDAITLPDIQPCNGRVIVVLTSWIKRVNTVHLTIKSILAQTRQPDLIVLYFANSEFPNHEADLPSTLTDLLSNDRFEIHWVEKDTKHYKRLRGFEEFPEDIIVHIDDDMIFNRKWLARLLEGYNERPGCIQCNSADTMYFDENEQLELVYGCPYDCPTYLNLPVGYLGILYPPHCIREENFKDKDLWGIIPNLGDHWSGLMGTLNGFRVNIVKCDFEIMSYIPDTQDVKINAGTSEELHEKHLTQINNVFNEYPGLRDILWQEWLNAKPD